MRETAKEFCEGNYTRETLTCLVTNQMNDCSTLREHMATDRISFPLPHHIALIPPTSSSTPRSSTDPPTRRPPTCQSQVNRK